VSRSPTPGAITKLLTLVVGDFVNELLNDGNIYCMNRIKLLFSILAIPLGVFMFIYGEYDDSPGGQLLGIALVIAGIVGALKSNKSFSTD